ncbi:MAG: hypothetical protein GX443_05430 [Deltaproteobacteria bacterium]|nr:hypothetical protein [Deltaproteobacteria bacterium]
MLDQDSGLYVFELILGFKCKGQKLYSPLCLILADDPEEAMEKAEDYLCRLDITGHAWIEEVGEPRDPEEYQAQFLDNGRELPPVLDDMSDEELRDFLCP